MEKAIEFENIGKQYRLGVISTGTISHDLNRWWSVHILRREDPYLKIGEVNDRSLAGESDYVWALRNINFSVEKGEVVGIIGRNGSGKSTLLKLLSRVTSPTTGKIVAEGRIASLLEVGTGFHPEMTGRENIFLNGAIMGMTKAEIARKLDEIVDFSGCERYLDTPVKRYSSGMIVRLGFAIAAHLEPEILVVDEVLAVGDAEFQQKAIGKMQDVAQGGGRTVLFVSHNMNAVRNLCRRGIVLNNGQLVYDGAVNDAVNFYLHNGCDSDIEGKEITAYISSSAYYIRIDKILYNGSSRDVTVISNNQSYVDLIVEGHTELPLKADLSLTIRNMDETPLASLSTGHFTGLLDHVPAGDFVLKKRIRLPHFLFKGTCLVDIALHQPGVSMHFYAPRAVRMEIEGNTGTYGHALQIKDNGLVGLECNDIE